jgi:hypothetical protein
MHDFTEQKNKFINFTIRDIKIFAGITNAAARTYAPRLRPPCWPGANLLAHHSHRTAPRLTSSSHSRAPPCLAGRWAAQPYCRPLPPSGQLHMCPPVLDRGWQHGGRSAARSTERSQTMPSDVDMSTSDTTGTGCTRCRDIYQVNSSSSFKLYFYIILDKNKTRSVVSSTVSKYLCKPRVKIRLGITPCVNSYVHVHVHARMCKPMLHAWSFCLSRKRKTRASAATIRNWSSRFL